MLLALPYRAQSGQRLRVRTLRVEHHLVESSASHRLVSPRPQNALLFLRSSHPLRCPGGAKREGKPGREKCFRGPGRYIMQAIAPAMEEAPTSETTRLLRAWSNGDRGALDQLTPRVYHELRRIAGCCLQAERPGRSIQTTALAHEAYLRLIDTSSVDWQHRAHFFAVCATMMRHILLDRARRRVAVKRGGAMSRVNLDEIPDLSSRRAGELIALDDALKSLANIDPRKAKVIELRFFREASCQGNSRSTESVTRYRDARLAARQSVATDRVERQEVGHDQLAGWPSRPLRALRYQDEHSTSTSGESAVPNPDGFKTTTRTNFG